MKTEYQIIAVDFDGTLCTDCFPKIGQPNTALIELLKGCLLYTSDAADE